MMQRWMMLIALLLVSQTAASADSKTVQGYWLVKKKDVLVEIRPCNKKTDTLCGYIAWLDANAKQQHDNLNPDETLRARALCGIRVMWDMQAEDADKTSYTGQIYKANDGSIYDATMKLADADTLQLRGYIGVPLIGKTAKLARVNPRDYKRCI